MKGVETPCLGCIEPCDDIQTCPLCSASYICCTKCQQRFGKCYICRRNPHQEQDSDDYVPELENAVLSERPEPTHQEQDSDDDMPELENVVLSDIRVLLLFINPNADLSAIRQTSLDELHTLVNMLNKFLREQNTR